MYNMNTTAKLTLLETIKTVLAIKKALETAGVEFIGSPDDRPGVRLK